MSDSFIRIAGVPEHFNLPLHVGIEQKHFERVDAAAEFQVFSGGTGAMMKAVANEEVDLAIVLTEGCAQALVSGVPGKIVKTFVESPLIWGIHTPASSSITDVDQMQGRRYAISRFGSGSHLMAIVDADSRGWPTDELSFVTVKNLEGAREALAADEADIFFWERFTTSPYVANGEFQRIGQRLTPWPAFVVCVGDRALAEHGPAITRMLNQTNKLTRQLKSDAKKTIETISDRYKLPVEQTQRWFETLAWSSDWKMDHLAYLSAVGYLQKLNLLDDSAPAEAEKIWDAIYLNLEEN